MSPRDPAAPALPPARDGWTLSQLREFHADQAWLLEADAKRRGAWPGETDRRAAFDATVRVLELILADRDVLARLKAKATEGG